MDGWGFLGNWKRRMSACEEGKDMIGIAYLVEGSGALSNETLRGWLGGESPPTCCCGHCSWKKKKNYTVDRETSTDSSRHTKICKSIAYFQVRTSRYVKF